MNKELTTVIRDTTCYACKSTTDLRDVEWDRQKKLVHCGLCQGDYTKPPVPPASCYKCKTLEDVRACATNKCYMMTSTVSEHECVDNVVITIATNAIRDFVPDGVKTTNIVINSTNKREFI